MISIVTSGFSLRNEVTLEAGKIILKILKDQTQLMEHWVEYHTSQAKTSFHLLTNNITKELIQN